MPIPSSIDDLDPVAANNSPSGSDSPVDGDNFLRAHAAIIKQQSVAYAAGDGPELIGFDADESYSADTVGKKLQQIVHVEDDGAVGDGTTDDEVAVLAAITRGVALGREIHFDGAKTYSIDTNSWTVTAGAKLVTNGCAFKCPFTTTSNTVWMTVGDGCVIDELNVSVPTAIRRDRLLTVGANCNIGSISVTSVDVQATAESGDFGVRLFGDGTRVGEISTTNYDRAVMVYQSENCEIGGIEVSGYVRGLYIFESPGLRVGKSHIHTASANASYTAGHNGVLVSSDTLDFGHDIVLADFHVENAGEHAFRIGGALTQENIWVVRGHVNNCGGCGFKVLGTDAVTPTDRNGTVYFVDCVAEDVGTDTLSDNKCAFLIMHADRVRLINPVVRSVDNTYSSYACLRVVATADLSVVNPYFEDAQTDGIWLDGSESGDDNDRFSVFGGICRGNGQDGLRIATGSNTVRRFNIDGLAMDSNARYGFNIAKGGSGTITDSVMKVKTHNNTSGAGACDADTVFMDVFGLPGSTAISGITAGNGSTWHDQTTLNYRKAGAWVAL